MQFTMEVLSETPLNEREISCPKCLFSAEFSEFKTLFFCPECELFSVISQNSRSVCPHCRYVVPDDQVSAPCEYKYLLNENTIFDKYRIIRPLGHGGMSEVYQAEHILLGQTCALKIMRLTGDKKNSAYYKRFLRETQCFWELVHPNIIRVYDSGCDPVTGYLFIMMEYLDSGSLAENISGKMSEAELLEIASDMSEALAELEKHNIIHRDIKPGNIMRTSSGHYKLMDLGIAKREDADSQNYTLTVDSTVFGTPAYASPEQCQSPHNVDIRSDIYSLGATLYHLACGELPFDGNTPVETILKVVQQEPESLRKKADHLSEKMIDLIECMMAKSPAGRPQNSGELQKMIRRVKNQKLRMKKLKFRLDLLLCRRIAVAVLLLIISGAVFHILQHRRSQVPSVKPSLPVAEAVSHAPAKVLMYRDSVQEPEKITAKVTQPVVKETSRTPVKVPPKKVVECAFKFITPVKLISNLRLISKRYPYIPFRSKWVKAPVDSWEINFASAFKKAEKQNKKLLILGASSKNMPGFFLSEQFQEYIKNDFVLLFLDCERKMMPPEQAKHCIAVRHLFFAMQCCPTTVIIGPGAKHLTTIPGLKNHQDRIYFKYLDAVNNGRTLHFNNKYIPLPVNHEH